MVKFLKGKPKRAPETLSALSGILESMHSMSDGEHCACIASLILLSFCAAECAFVCDYCSFCAASFRCPARPVVAMVLSEERRKVILDILHCNDAPTASSWHLLGLLSVTFPNTN